MLAKVLSSAVIGIDAYVVEVEVEGVGRLRNTVMAGDPAQLIP